MTAASHTADTIRPEAMADATTDNTDQTFLRLERLSRKAANDSLRTRGGHLADDQFDALAAHLLSIGINAYRTFDPALTVSDRDGYSHAYRAMRGYRQGRFTEGPYIDWLRSNVCDTRFEPATSTTVTDSGDLPETDAVDIGSFDAAIMDLGRGLSTRSLWTLHHIAGPRAEWARSIAELALEHGMTKSQVRERIAELQAELRGEPPPPATHDQPEPIGGLMEWVA